MIALFDRKWQHLGYHYGACTSKCPSLDCFRGFPAHTPNSSTCARARSPQPQLYRPFEDDLAWGSCVFSPYQTEDL